MGKFIKYDEAGNEVVFDFGIDAREAVLTGRYFDTNPKETAKKSDEPEAKKEKVSKKSDAPKSQDGPAANSSDGKENDAE